MLRAVSACLVSFICVFSSSFSPAQQTPTDTQRGSQTVPPARTLPAPTTLTIPAGTVLHTTLINVFRTMSARGTTLAVVLPYAQLEQDQLTLPEGTSLEGEVLSVKGQGHFLPVYEIRLRSANLVLPDSTIVPLHGELTAWAGEPAVPYETYLPRKKDWALIGTGAAISAGSVIIGSIKEAHAFSSSMPSLPAMPAFTTTPPFPPMPSFPSLPSFPATKPPSNAGMKIILIGSAVGSGFALAGVLGQRNNAIVYPGAPLDVRLAQPLHLDVAQVRRAAKSARSVTVPPPPVLYPPPVYVRPDEP